MKAIFPAAGTQANGLQVGKAEALEYPAGRAAGGVAEGTRRVCSVGCARRFRQESRQAFELSCEGGEFGLDVEEAEYLAADFRGAVAARGKFAEPPEAVSR